MDIWYFAEGNPQFLSYNQIKDLIEELRNNKIKAYIAVGGININPKSTQVHEMHKICMKHKASAVKKT